MNWQHIKLIFRREMRDQLRDRRTLFLIAVLPILFYPLLGISFMQIAQFLRQHPSKILIVGHESMRNDLPKLIEEDRFAKDIYDPKKSHLVDLTFLPPEKLRFVQEDKWPKNGVITEQARRELNEELHRLMKRHDCDAVVFFPPNFFLELENYFDEFSQRARSGEGALPLPPQPQLLFDNSTDKKGIAHVRVSRALEDWSSAVGRRSLQLAQMNSNVSHPIGITQYNVATEDRVNTSLWSKVLPFVLLIWAVTGAFYPAVDLCAGEKERGTLETLLSSPARRGEIVLGKLLTVMCFSIATAVLNLVSIGVTGTVVMKQMSDMAEMANVGAPPFTDMIWLTLILIPLAALFSAVCLALAAFARSTKEGQYYLMPVILVTMPLILLPMKPDIELNLGFSLIPVSGAVLLMRSVMEGTFHELWLYIFPVAAVTFGCCWLSVRWAIDQFNSEDVLFREGERWDVWTMVRYVIHERKETPTVALAFLCGTIVLIAKFFMPSVIDGPKTLAELQQISVDGLARFVIITQVFMILAPAVILALLTTRRPRKTFQTKTPVLWSLPAAAVLAVALLPMVIALQLLLGQFFDPRPEIQQYSEVLEAKLNEAPMWYSLILIALVPALCEEFTFRGFVLSGFRHSGYKWRAIILTSFFFAVAHPFMEQMINAFFLGLILGYLAVQTGSIGPPLVYHFVHNGTLYVTKRIGILDEILTNDVYAGWLLMIGTLLAVLIVFRFDQLDYGRTKEETLQEAIRRESGPAIAETA